ncbi:ATP-binding protein [Paenibacillus sp. EC2-1]|uniref:ATP-binding protein n=1 Tax=Paenibacillus sp. EC2-1 TaxID=3388665 RepID=UPI003BEEC73D
MQPSNSEMDHLKNTIERLSDQIIRSKAQEEKALTEFSAMNNELVTLQRQLAKTNAELTEARIAAERANEAKSSLLAMISHEIRTPMSGIIGMTELIESEELSTEHREMMNVIQDSAGLLLNMINDLLDLSKIDAGKMELKTEQVRIKSIIDHIVKLLDIKIKNNGNILLFHIDEELNENLIGDSGRLTQILLNLLSNANKFTSYGHLNLRVKLLEDAEDYQYIRFEVEDNGIGISLEDQDRLFQPYTQTDEGSSPQYGGTGLGLSICKSFVELMNGQIGVDSEPGKGSCFWFEVQLQKGDRAVNSDHEDPQNHSNLDLERLDNRTVNVSAPVLVAEDNPINRQVIVMQLRKLGVHDVDTVNDGEEVILAARRRNYSLIFMDHMMPKIKGLEAAVRIREHETAKASGHVPIIALTGNASESVLEQCLNAGMNDYLPKPSTVGPLAKILRRWLPYAQESLILDDSIIREIQALSKGEESDLLSVLFQMYTEDTPGKINDLQQAGEDLDTDRIAAVAHDLKSSSLSLGIVRLSDILTQIETAAKEGRIDTYKETVKLLLPAYEEACEALQQYLQ